MNRTTRISRFRTILYSLVPAGLLLLLLSGTEVILRMTLPDPDPPLLRQVRYDGVDWFEPDRGFLARYFPGAPTVPEFKSSLVRVSKPANGFRVICLGGSSMFGTPYDMNANIPGIVRKHLRRALPERNVEVLNLGASAINSNVVRDFLPQLDVLHPDLVLVYMGHNEFYGPDGVGASWAERELGFPTRWKYALRGLRLFQLAGKLFASRQQATGGEGANLMKQVSQGQLVTRGSGESERIVSGFAGNLLAVVRYFQEKKIPLIVSEVSSNMLFPPFVSDSLAGTAGSGMIFDAVRTDVQAGRYQAVLDRYRKLDARDTLNPFLAYWAGRAALALGESARASLLLDRARDEDLLRFRAPSAINRAIRGVCLASGAPLLRADSILRTSSRGGITGDDLFWEHLHPRVEGYYRLATGFVEKLEEIGLIPPVNPIPLRRDSLSIAWFEEAYADMSIQHLTGRWPFEEYRRTPAVLAGADPLLLKLVADTYQRTIPWNDGCYRSATYFWSKGDLGSARTTYEAMLEEYPESYYTNYLLATLLNLIGETDLAVHHYQRSLASNGGYPKARVDLGLLEVQRGNLDAAIGLFDGVLPMLRREEDRDLRSVVFYGLAAAYARKGERGKALEAIDVSLREMPQNRNAASLRRQILGAGP